MSNEKTFSIILNSKYKNSGSLSNPQFILDDNLAGIKSYKIKNLMIPLAIPVIDSRNNKIYFREGTAGSLKTATLDSGSFTGTSFASNLQNALTSTGSTSYNVSYNTTTNKMTINNGTGGVFAFTNGSSLITGFYESGLENQLNTFGSSFTTSNVDLSGLKILNIVSNFGGLKINNQQKRLLASIITEESQLSVSSFIDDSNDFITPNVSELSSLELSFLDDQMRQLTLDKDYQLEILFKN